MKNKTQIELLLRNYLAFLEVFEDQDDLEIEEQLNIAPAFIRMLAKETQEALDELQRTP